MVRDEIRRRWGAGIAWLRHSTGQSPQLTLWGWVGDALVALALTIGAIAGVTYHSDNHDGKIGFVMVRPGSPAQAGPEAPVAPDAPAPVDPAKPNAYRVLPLPGSLPVDQGVPWW